MTEHHTDGRHARRPAATRRVPGLRRAFGADRRPGRPRPDGRAGRAARAARPVRLRQDHRAAHARRLRDARTPARCSSTARTSPGVPANRRDAGMVFQSYSLFPQPQRAATTWPSGCGCARCAAAERRARAAELLELVGPRRPGRPLPAPALRRPAAARRAGPRARAASRGCCCSTSRCRRWTPRCGCTLREEIRRLQQRARHHHPLRDPRPGGGAVHGRPGRA